VPKTSPVGGYVIGPRTFVTMERGAVGVATDPMSNIVFLGESDVQAMISNPVKGGLPLSDKALRFLLHELTHHASFAGWVGNAQSALLTSVGARASIGTPPDGPAGLWLGQRDDLVVRSFSTLMEPLVEGLALFAEHDICWGPLQHASHALLHVWSLFIFAEAIKAASGAFASGGADAIERARKAHTDAINGRLKAARTSDYWVKQKALLLGQPLLGDGLPPYLLGYLTIKRAYLRLRHTDMQFSEPDGFLLLMVTWFDDAKIANLLVELQDRNVVAVQKTIKHLIESFQDLWDLLYAAPELASAKYPPTRLPGPGDEFTPFGLGVGFRVAAETMNFFTPKFHKHRLVLRLGVLRADITTTGANTAIVRDARGGKQILECPATTLAPKGRYPGTIEVVRTYDGKRTAVAVLGPTGLVAVRDLFDSTWNSDDLVHLFDDLPSVEYAEAAAQAYENSFIVKSWESGGEFGPLNDHLTKEALRARDYLYPQIAFALAREDRTWDGVVSRLGKAGFRTLFEEADELEELARLSMYFGGAGALISEVSSGLNRGASDLESKLKAINSKARRELGFDLFEIEGERVISAV
jgi:hypothetical protein